jgi:hypothetical protein
MGYSSCAFRQGDSRPLHGQDILQERSHSGLFVLFSVHFSSTQLPHFSFIQLFHILHSSSTCVAFLLHLLLSSTF